VASDATDRYAMRWQRADMRGSRCSVLQFSHTFAKPRVK
jgi:hypothetical protein